MNSRRDFLAQLIAAGGIAALPVHEAFAQVMSTSANRKEFAVLAPNQAQFLARLADIIIPLTDTPKASDTGVIPFIDTMLSDWYTGAETMMFLRGLDKSLAGLGSTVFSIYIGNLDALSFSEERADTPQQQFYRMAKELVLVGYFTSPDGMRQGLHTLGPVGSHSFEPSGPPGDPIKY
ncbi:MAG: gluconate 2-dehydrogenase subunit 3 family protein [Halieaceae bacterium]|jgi:hypothetical protein|nr:gluconate 2-dehydrogenase subunit 3 family protein [Halieaceae bacterium]